MTSTSAIRTIKLLIAYDGTDYCGWQKQKNGPTIQGEIEKSLQRMTCEPTTVHGAGRTDAGVHAESMTAHFKTTCRIPCRDLQRGLNSLLPGSIRIYSVQEVSSDFHARFSAQGKTYRYTLFTGTILPPLLRKHCVHIKSDLDIPAMQQCMNVLCGTHDFSSFENSGSRDKTVTTGRGAIRTITAATIQEDPAAEQLHFLFTGDGFLKNMIRNLMGTLLDVGRGKTTTGEFETILRGTDRKLAGPTAPAHGLTLLQVYYNNQHDFRKTAQKIEIRHNPYRLFKAE